MDIGRLGAACVRRWYLLLPLLLLTGLGVVVAGDRVDPEYQSNASILLYEGAADAPGPNPYGTPVEAASNITVIATGDTFRSEIRDAGLSTTYEIEEANARPGRVQPLLAILVRASTPDLATETRDAVIDRMGTELNERQAQFGVPAAARTSLSVLDAPENVSTLTTGPFRAQVVVLVLGVALSFLLVVLLDDLILGARRRKEALRAAAKTELTAPRSGTGAPGRPVVRDVDPTRQQLAGASGRDGSSAS